MLTFIDTLFSGNVVGVKVDGKLTDADYQRLIAKFEEVIREHGKISVFFELEDCQGWDMGAVWDELPFTLKHLGDFDRCAVIGGHGEFGHPLMPVLLFFDVKYFAKPHFKEAWEWVTENVGEDSLAYPTEPAAVNNIDVSKLRLHLLRESRVVPAWLRGV